MKFHILQETNADIHLRQGSATTHPGNTVFKTLF